jgi:hypothetical protein
MFHAVVSNLDIVQPAGGLSPFGPQAPVGFPTHILSKYKYEVKVASAGLSNRNLNRTSFCPAAHEVMTRFSAVLEVTV